ncbi:1,4-alpha-glucan branching protein GlgB [Methyloligella sp. 2.7D]|uniref:1,4-alpha-glucan branching protein GlgB n=1 Tax=unclassified Methyloligella TaxID=2625955 RepID=UPI00157D402F|nr:1,4-alpha-glucan branching protein GlgB [Methyloligella sp. GL2]QKP76994.1 1,4-alpha-glucan branching protein GlgB [Methyloligella sp. GL2]
MTALNGNSQKAYAPTAGEIDAIAHGTHSDPFAVLGLQGGNGSALTVRIFVPGAERVELLDYDGTAFGTVPMLHRAGFFGARFPSQQRIPYRLRVHKDGASWEAEDPYRFPSAIPEMDLELIANGDHLKLYETLGAHPMTLEGVAGVRFAVWAPNAKRVSVIGNFNQWDGRRHVMRRHARAGVWDIFIPGIEKGEVYKFEILGHHGELLPQKADPVAFQQEHPPATASIVHGPAERLHHAPGWPEQREKINAIDAPISIYEMHLGSWMRGPENKFLTYDEIADRLIPYLQDLGFTHVELMPVSEFPFDGSWGYQPIGLYAPTSRFGTPEGFSRFVRRLHDAGIGVIVDWVAAHFPTDTHGLGHFDGSALYEHEDPRRGFHHDWNTLIYNYGRKEVANFLIANALYWLDHFDIDGLRADAVASMLYLDYSRKEGEWLPNEHGGNENLEALAFIKRLNEVVYKAFPGTAMIAEESTAWPGVSQPTYAGGLGFGYKWNMGWMHDTLNYISEDPVHRKYHHHNMTFGLVYGFSENFILPLSHDEVVHGKGSLIARMPGDRWQKFANLRAYFGFMWGHPGKKLLFMGGEFAQEREWNHDYALDWEHLDDPYHSGVQSLVRDLNKLYRSSPALYALDTKPEGFEWVVSHDEENSVIAFLRKGEDGTPPMLVISNFTPIPRYDYRVWVPEPGTWRERLNTDAKIYGGGDVGNGGAVEAEPVPHEGHPYSVGLTLPPLGTLFLELQE